MENLTDPFRQSVRFSFIRVFRPPFLSKESFKKTLKNNYKITFRIILLVHLYNRKGFYKYSDGLFR